MKIDIEAEAQQVADELPRARKLLSEYGIKAGLKKMYKKNYEAIYERALEIEKERAN